MLTLEQMEVTRNGSVLFVRNSVMLCRNGKNEGDSGPKWGMESDS